MFKYAWAEGINSSKSFTVKESKEREDDTSLVVQWLRPHAPNAGGTSSIPVQGTKSLHVATEEGKKIPHTLNGLPLRLRQ